MLVYETFDLESILFIYSILRLVPEHGFILGTVKIKDSDIKGTVSVMSCHPPCQEGNALFTTVPFKQFAEIL